MSKSEEMTVRRQEPAATAGITKKMRLSTDRDQVPNLQLSLRPNSDLTKEKKHGEGEEEVNSELTLTLSPPAAPVQREDCNMGAGMEFLEKGSSSSKKAALGLSTLDLTMSIKALE